MREQQPFVVLPGGLSDPVYRRKKEFVSAYVTDTRLMGVVGMYIHFRLPGNPEEHLHQFFYFDVEDYGFEAYNSVLSNDPAKISEAESSMLACLGGTPVEITRREAQYVLQSHVRFNQQKQIPLPEGLSEYNFLLEDQVRLSEGEKRILMEKQCVEINSPRSAINYFLMRAFAKDLPAMDFLTDGLFCRDLFPEKESGVLCRNRIRRDEAPDMYISESLVEYPDHYVMFVISIRLSGTLVSEFSLISVLRITPMEAAMQLARSEFVSVYEMLHPEEFTKASTHLCASATETNYENGTLFMVFHADNRHVDRWEYQLNEDVHGMYFVTHHGQLIAAAYSLDDIQMLEKDLDASPIGRKIFPSARYEFQDPVLFEFIQGPFTEFHHFVNFIRGDDE